MPIASISKLVTALTVADAKQPMDEVIEITEEDRALGKGASSRLAAWCTRLTRGDLFHLALMASENRAAHALARNYPGGIAAFMPAMNAKARELGMTSSHFVEPTGLSSDNVASPEDLSKLVMAASKNATIREYSTDPGYDVRVGRRMVGFHNTNSLVNNPTWDIVVQKTGYIEEAGRCLVMQTVIEGRTIVIVLLNSFGKQTRVADATRVRKWMEAAAAGCLGRSRGQDLSLSSARAGRPAAGDGHHDIDRFRFGIEDDLCLAPLQLPGNLRYLLIERDVPLAIFRTFPQHERLEHSAQRVLG